MDLSGVIKGIRIKWRRRKYDHTVCKDAHIGIPINNIAWDQSSRCSCIFYKPFGRWKRQWEMGLGQGKRERGRDFQGKAVHTKRHIDEFALQGVESICTDNDLPSLQERAIRLDR